VLVSPTATSRSFFHRLHTHGELKVGMWRKRVKQFCRSSRWTPAEYGKLHVGKFNGCLFEDVLGKHWRKIVGVCKGDDHLHKSNFMLVLPSARAESCQKGAKTTTTTKKVPKEKKKGWMSIKFVLLPSASSRSCWKNPGGKQNMKRYPLFPQNVITWFTIHTCLFVHRAESSPQLLSLYLKFISMLHDGNNHQV